MFGFLKDKLKNAIGKFSKDVEKEAVVEKKEIITEKPAEKKREEKKTETVTQPKQEKKSLFKKIFGKKDAEEKAEEKEEILEELEGVEEEETIIEEKKEMPKSIEIKEKVNKHNLEKNNANTKNIKTQTSINKPIKPDDAKDIEQIQKIKVKVETKEDKNVYKNTNGQITNYNLSIKPSSEIEGHKIIKSDKTIIEDEPREKKGFFTKITETFTKFNISEQKFEELFWDLEIAMLENNVAVEVIDKIKTDMKKELMKDKISRSGVETIISNTLKKSIIELFDVEKRDLLSEIKKKKPYIIAVIGVNGSGKTTSIAKLTHKFQKSGLKVVLAASDTFRAAAIQQLEEHANRLDVKLIKHDYHSDPAAVAFDAIKYAQAKGIDVVIIDTAGRLHSNTNLMEELKKVVRVCKPDIKIFVGESITGNDCVEQAKEFDKAVGIDAIILAKADIDEKGGAAISVSYVTKKPILYLGTGQTYDDLKEFDSKLIIESLEL